MGTLRSYLIRLRNFFRREQLDQDLTAELGAHLDLHIEDNLRAGMTPEEAHRVAILKLGGLQQTKESVRDRRGIPFLETLLQDIRLSLRMFRKNPGFTAVAVLTLALGIGANAVIFALVDSALLRALPFHDPDRLVHVWTTDAGGEVHTPVPEQFSAIQKSSASFEQVAAAGWADEFYGSDESLWQNLQGFLVSSNWLPTLGIQPLLGRNFRAEEQIPGQGAVVILSNKCWRTRFRGDPAIVGRQITLNRRIVTIVGVLPQSLGPYYPDIEIYAPLVFSSYANNGNIRAGIMRVQILARLKPGTSLDQARSEAQVIAQQFGSSTNSGDRSGQLLVQPFLDEFENPGPTVQNTRRGLWMMAAASALVLLIASANVSSLLLARGVTRQREVAVRTSLGCSRLRMIRQFLTETTVLFVCGAALGLLVARWSQEFSTKITAGMISSGTYLEVNSKVFAIGLGLSFLCALVFGMLPALQATRLNLADILKEAALNASNGLRSRDSRNLLVVFQLAFGMVLLVGFGLLFRSLLRVESADLGFDPNKVLTASVRLPQLPYKDPSARAGLARAVIERLHLIPAVESAGITDSLPMEGADSITLKIEVPSQKGTSLEADISYLSVDPGYLATLRVSLLAGRLFSDSDNREAIPVAIINRSFAEQYFRGANPLGLHIVSAGSPPVSREIVGVVSNFKQRNPDEDYRPLVYFPLAQTLPGGRWNAIIRLRSQADIALISRTLSGWLRPVDPQLYWELGSAQRLIDDSESLTLRRPIIRLLGAFALLALILALAGIFGVTSYSVAERTREIGIRAALGANHREIASLVLRETLKVALGGLVVGALIAVLLSRFLPTGPIGWSGSGIFLYGVSRVDIFTFASAATLLAATALAAAYLPARRATRVDPMVALRHE